jgi:hypothetical protein
VEVKIGDDWESERGNLLEALREFAVVTRGQPFQNSEGLRGVNAFALYWFIKKIKPTVVFEVGVWKGFSTWLIEQAAPDAEVYCFDPIFFLEHYIDPKRIGRTYRSRRAHYSTQDFSCAGVKEIAARHARPLSFFDDHQNKLPRLLQSREAGIKELVFDDNTSEPYTHRTLEQERRDPRSSALLEREVESYEIFPALWEVDFVLGPQHIKERGLNFPQERLFRPIYDERRWHSYVTHVRLK